MEVCEMNHQKYEQLLFEQENLSSEKREQLDAHLRECSRCALLSDRLSAVENILRSAPSVAPAPGFAARFQMRLEKARQKRQARTLLLMTSLSVIGVLIGLGLISYLLLSYGATIFSWILKGFNQFYWVGTAFDVFVSTTILILESIVEQLPLVTLTAISAALSILVLTWITSFYRLSYLAIRRE
jgi:predicted anti-sigma-YlaC factor YlaD